MPPKNYVQTLEATRRQLLADCQAQTRVLTFTLSTLAESLAAGDDAQAVVAAFQAAAEGCLDNVKTSIAIAITATGTIHRLHGESRIETGTLVQQAIAAELALAMGESLACTRFEQQAIDDTNEKLDQLEMAIAEVSSLVASTEVSRRDLVAVISQLRATLDSLASVAAADDERMTSLLQVSEALSAALSLSLQSLRKGFADWHEAMRRINSESN